MRHHVEQCAQGGTRILDAAIGEIRSRRVLLRFDDVVHAVGEHRGILNLGFQDLFGEHRRWIEGAAEVESAICQQANSSILLPGIVAVAQKDGKQSNLKFTARGGGADWMDTSVSLIWSFKVEKAGTYKIDVVTTETGSHGTPVWQGGQSIKIKCAGQEISSTITDERREYNQRSQYWKLIHSGAGKIKFDKAGTYDLTLIPQNFFDNKIGFTFKEINLNPLK